MPRISKTIVPRVRKSLRDHGFLGTLFHSFVVPLRLLGEYRAAKALRSDQAQTDQVQSDFDQTHGVNTDGEFNGWTYLSDLEIPSPNWIEGVDYAPIEPERFQRVIAALPIVLKDYTFIDFGSGKGRALLLASEFPFKRIIGLEFSPELHQIAEENVRRFPVELKKCRDIQSRNIDFVEFSLPSESLVLFFFDPCKFQVLSKVVAHIRESLRADPRPLFLIYVAPQPEHEKLFRDTGFLKQIVRNSEMNFVLYKNLAPE